MLLSKQLTNIGIGIGFVFTAASVDAQSMVISLGILALFLIIKTLT